MGKTFVNPDELLGGLFALHHVTGALERKAGKVRGPGLTPDVRARLGVSSEDCERNRQRHGDDSECQR